MSKALSLDEMAKKIRDGWVLSGKDKEDLRKRLAQKKDTEGVGEKTLRRLRKACE